MKQYMPKEEKRYTKEIIRPEMPLGVGRMEKDTAKVRAAYERGRADALAQLDALRTFLKGE